MPCPLVPTRALPLALPSSLSVGHDAQSVASEGLRSIPQSTARPPSVPGAGAHLLLLLSLVSLSLPLRLHILACPWPTHRAGLNHPSPFLVQCLGMSECYGFEFHESDEEKYRVCDYYSQVSGSDTRVAAVPGTLSVPCGADSRDAVVVVSDKRGYPAHS